MKQQKKFSSIQKIIEHIEIVTEKTGYNPVFISDIYYRCISELEREKLIYKKIFIEGMLAYMELQNLIEKSDIEYCKLLESIAEEFINDNFFPIKPIL